MQNGSRPQTLLEEISKIVKEQNAEEKRSGAHFNVFSILNAETDEVNTHCRLLFELLNPFGSHGWGDCFLREFFSTVLHKAYPTCSVHVYREYPITRSSTGRIDLLLKGNGFCYPIEVKINAGDQELQLKRYSDFAAYAQDNQVYYLTLDGHLPSETSIGQEMGTKVECISFSNEIREWLMKCINIAEAIPSISEILRQYVSLLEQMTGSEQEDEYMKQISDVISSSRENYESAVAISQAMPTIYEKMMVRVFDEIREHIGDRLDLLFADYLEKAHDYNHNLRYTFPCIVYRLSEQEGQNLCFIIEVYWTLYCGLAFYDKKSNKRLEKLTRSLPDAGNTEAWEEMFSMLSLLDDKKDAWVYSLPYDTPLDFWNADGIFPDLFDAKRHMEIMQEVYAEIDEMIEQLRELNLIEE